MTVLQRQLLFVATLGLFSLVHVSGLRAQFFIEIQQLEASDAAPHDMFGNAVSISGAFAIIGAYGTDDRGSFSGSAYLFKCEDDDGNWREIEELTASDADALDMFGYAVSISGDRIIIGAPRNDDLGGAAYIFERDSTGSWTEIQKLTVSKKKSFGRSRGRLGSFGISVALSEDRAIVGMTGGDELGSDIGAAYVFEREESGSWKEVQKLTPSDGAAEARFGRSVSLAGGRALVASLPDDDQATGVGAVYLFQRDRSGHWTQIQKLTASDAAVGDDFGCSLAQFDDHVLVGAQGDDDHADFCGSAYIFERCGNGHWTEAQKLTANDAGRNHSFGNSVSLIENVALVGARASSGQARYSGAVYAYQRQQNGEWQQLQKLLAGDRREFANFGWSISASGDLVLVGAKTTDNDDINNSGSAYIFKQLPTKAKR